MTHMDYGGRRFTIAKMDRNRIASVTIASVNPAAKEP